MSYIVHVSIISVNDLKTRSAEQWFKSGDDKDLVVTSEGKPVAILLPTDQQSLEATLSTIRSLRAVQAQTALQAAAAANGLANLTIEDIDAEIVAARKSRTKP